MGVGQKWADEQVRVRKLPVQLDAFCRRNQVIMGSVDEKYGAFYFTQ